jgi:acyl-CoA thioester hydrolase
MNQRLYPAAYRAGTQRFRLVTSQNAVHFLAEAHWPVTIQTGAGVGRIGRTSFVASTGLFVAGDCIGVCDTVLVMLGDDGPAPISEGFREALEGALLNRA